MNLHPLFLVEHRQPSREKGRLYWRWLGFSLREVAHFYFARNKGSSALLFIAR